MGLGQHLKRRFVIVVGETQMAVSELEPSNF